MKGEPVLILDLRKTFLYCLLLNGLLFFGLLITHRLYLDDIARSMFGYSRWFVSGRPLADVFIVMVQLGTPIINLFPLPQIISIFIISLTCVWLARSYSVSSPFFAAVCTLPLAGQPYFLENMSFSFDCLSMTLALSLSIYAAILLSVKRKHSLVSSILLLLSVLCLYQAAVGAFFVTYIFLIIKNINTDKRPQEYLLSYLSRLVLGSCVAFLLYVPISRQFLTGDYAAQHSKIVGLHNIFYKVCLNTSNYIELLINAWSGNIIGYIFLLIFVLSILISVMQAVWNSSRQSAPRVTLYAIILLILGVTTIVASFFPQMFLADPHIRPRVFIGFGAILSCCSLNVYSCMNSNVFHLGKYRRYILVAPVCAVAYSLILFSYAYSSANWAQRHYEDIVISGLQSDMDRLITDKNITRFVIAGNIGHSPLVVNTARKYPLIGELVTVHIIDNWHGYMLLKLMGLPLTQKIKADHQTNISQGEILDIIKNNNPIVNRSKYRIYLNDDLMLIKFF